MALVVKNPPANAGDTRVEDSMPGWGRAPGGGNGNPLQYPCLEKSHGQRSLLSMGLMYLMYSQSAKQVQKQTYRVPFAAS